MDNDFRMSLLQVLEYKVMSLWIRADSLEIQAEKLRRVFLGQIQETYTCYCSFVVHSIISRSACSYKPIFLAALSIAYHICY